MILFSFHCTLCDTVIRTETRSLTAVLVEAHFMAHVNELIEEVEEFK